MPNPQPPVPQPPAQAPKAFDIEGFFLNPAVLAFLKEFVFAIIGIFKGNISKDVEDQLKANAIQILNNMNQVLTPSFFTGLSNTFKAQIEAAVKAEVDRVIHTLKDEAVKPEQIKDLIKDSVALGVSEGMPLALDAFAHKLNATGNFTFSTVKSNGV